MPDASGGSRLWHGGMREVMNGVCIIIIVQYCGFPRRRIMDLVVFSS